MLMSGVWLIPACAKDPVSPTWLSNIGDGVTIGEEFYARKLYTQTLHRGAKPLPIHLLSHTRDLMF